MAAIADQTMTALDDRDALRVIGRHWILGGTVEVIVHPSGLVAVPGMRRTVTVGDPSDLVDVEQVTGPAVFTYDEAVAEFCESF